MNDNSLLESSSYIHENRLQSTDSTRPVDVSAPSTTKTAFRNDLDGHDEVRIPSAVTFIAQQLQNSQCYVDESYIPVSFRGTNGEVGKRDRSSHQFHWYPAKMFYRIPKGILDALNLTPESIVLDPFCGSGTVLVESTLHSCQSIGLDINPLSVLISKVKTTPLNEKKMERYASEIIELAKALRRIPHETDMLPGFWFNRPARNVLYRLLTAIKATTSDDCYQDFFLVTLTSIVRQCSRADPFIPPLVRMRRDRTTVAGSRYRAAYERSANLSNKKIYEYFLDRTQKNIERVSDNQNDPLRPQPIVLQRTALRTGLPDHHVDTIITSPPYCGAQKYVRTFKLELGLLGYSPRYLSSLDQHTLGTERLRRRMIRAPTDLDCSQHELLLQVTSRNPQRGSILSTYLAGLQRFAKEAKRILRPGGDAFFTFGVSQFAGISVDLGAYFEAFANRAGLKTIAKLTDRIPSRGMMTRRHRSASVIPSENLIWLRSK